MRSILLGKLLTSQHVAAVLCSNSRLLSHPNKPQMSFSDFEYAGKRKQTRLERFLAEMEQIGP